MIRTREIKPLVANVEARKIAENKGEEWTTLIHNGVLFPPNYEKLPSNVKILYDGKPITLDGENTKNLFNITAEEAAVFFAMKIDQDERLKKKKKAVDDKVFVKNFFNDWKKILPKDTPIKKFSQIDFSPICKYIKERSEKKKNALTKEEKNEQKKEKDAIKNLYGYAIVDGMLIPVGSFMVQPPGIFIGHASTPKRGCIKKRIRAEDVTLNLSKKDGIPACYDNGKPCKWGDIIENKKVTWLASYKNPITGSPVYVYLSRQDSHFVHRDDIAKFDKARKLAENIKLIREKYSKDLTSESNVAKQLATAVYLLDILAIRPGTEKDEEKEADTVGLTTLRCDNIRFEKNNKVTLNFLGKSSIEFNKTFNVDERVYKNLENLCKKGGKIFPGVDETTLNGYLKNILPEITSKVFRTYKACSTLQKQLDKTNPDPEESVQRKKLLFDKANMEVAVALNHKNMTVSDAKVEKLQKKLQDLNKELKESKNARTTQSLEKKIEKAQADLEQAKGNISLTTSKVNYIDPRIVVSWCKKHEIPIEKIYQKTALKKFVWSMDAKSDWKFV